jgi:hypothetical protein
VRVGDRLAWRLATLVGTGVLGFGDGNNYRRILRTRVDAPEFGFISSA